MKRLLFLLLIPAAAFPQAVKYTSQFRGGQIDTILSQAQYVGGPVWNVKNAPFNATGDGVTDDRAAVMAAFDSAKANGGTVYVPRGTYQMITFDTSAYETPDSVAAPGGYPTSFATTNVHLRVTASNIRLVGDGYGATIIRTALHSTLLLMSGPTVDSVLNGISIEGISFEYTGGYYGGINGGSYGVWVKGHNASVSKCKFTNFLNSVIIARGSTGCDVSHNVFEAEHGRASCGYPLYPDRLTGDIYWAHPAVFVRNYGLDTRMSFNEADGMTSADFTGITAPDSFKTPMDGFNHGAGSGGALVGNSIKHFYYEAYYSEEGQSTSTATLTYTGNTADGTVPTMTNGCPSTHAKYSVYGRYGIRADCWNVSIVGNTIRNIAQGEGILVAYATDPQRHFTITGNMLDNVARGIRVDSSRHGTISGNTIIGAYPTQAQKDSGFFFLRAIDIYRSFDLNISGNTIVGNHTGWYTKVDTATTQSDSGTATRIYLASTTGLSIGDWVVAHYDATTGDYGEAYYIDSVGTNYVRANDTIYSTIEIGDTVYWVPGGDQYVNDGVVFVSSDSCVVGGNHFVDINNPIYGMGDAHYAGPNYYHNCLSEPTGGLGVRFSLIGGATPISTSGTITTTGQLAGESLLLEPWYHIATTTGAFYLRPGSGQVAMYDGSTAHYQFDLYSGTTQRISFRSDNSSFILGKLGVGTAYPDSQVTATSIHSTGGLKVDGSVTIVGALTASSISGDTSATWGSITGTIANQTDLISEIEGKINDSLAAERAKIRTIGYAGLIDTMYTSDTVEVGWVGPATTITSIIYSGGRDISLTARIELVDSILQTDDVTLVDSTTCIGQKTTRSSAVAGGTFTLTEGKLLRLVFDMMDTPPKIFSATIKGKE